MVDNILIYKLVMGWKKNVPKELWKKNCLYFNVYFCYYKKEKCKEKQTQISFHVDCIEKYRDNETYHFSFSYRQNKTKKDVNLIIIAID